MKSPSGSQAHKMLKSLSLETDVYAGLHPAELWRHFYKLNQLPRPSGGEKKAQAYVQRVADAAKAPWKKDAKGNLVVYLPATDRAYSNAPTLAIQTHLDMVCDKVSNSKHDFWNDPIHPRRENGCIYATGTTLGADNGVGVAAALSFISRKDIEHGPLELIFTVEEETGLYGAAALNGSLIKATRLINLDSESVDTLTVGSAAGENAIIDYPITSETVPSEWIGREILISGLQGGHSGLQIQDDLANAIKLLASILKSARNFGVEYRIQSLWGGNADNSIPRSAGSSVAVAPTSLLLFEKLFEQSKVKLLHRWGKIESHLKIELRETPKLETSLIVRDRDALIDLLSVLPHGVLRLSKHFPGEVETSANLAQIIANLRHITIVTSCRSFVNSELQKELKAIEKIARKAGANYESEGAFPAWEPQVESDLLKLTKKVFRKIRGKEPEIKVTHGGLECGLIVSRTNVEEAISFGPSITGAHTPHECVGISSVEAMWKLLTALVGEISKKVVKHASLHELTTKE